MMQIKKITGELILEIPELRGAYLFRANLSRADLSRADLRGADLSGADLYGANLSGAYLFMADLRGAYLSGANLSRADLSRADLSRANLSRADLSGANLFEAYLSEAYLPIFCKWRVSYTTDGTVVKIGCKFKTVAEWDEWFSGSGEFDTPRDSEDFRRIEAEYLAVKAYITHLGIV